jgi:cyclophilin family peptidyl-prolyl cis-trans isomerase
MNKKIIFSMMIIFLALGVSGCAKREINNNYSSNQESEALIEQSIKEDSSSTTNLTNNLNNDMNQEILKKYSQAEFQTSLGNFTIEFFNDKMPITVANFLTLAEDGYFDGIKFHRVIKNFMIQGGDPLTKDDNQPSLWGTGGPGYAIADEHVADPELSNVIGTISMANSGPNSGGSQFFINVADNTFLDFDKAPLSSKHPVFGKVVEGMDVIEKISEVKTTQPGILDRPETPIVIKKVNLK